MIRIRSQIRPRTNKLWIRIQEARKHRYGSGSLAVPGVVNKNLAPLRFIIICVFFRNAAQQVLLTRSVTDLARLSLEQPVFVSVHENASHTTPDTLTQSYIVTDLQHKVNSSRKYTFRPLVFTRDGKELSIRMRGCKLVTTR
jgi:hypothetical protein